MFTELELKKKKTVENTSPCLDLHSEAHAHLRMDLRYPSHSHPQILSFKEFFATRNLLPHGELAEGSPERHEAVPGVQKELSSFVSTYLVEESGVRCVVDQPFQLVTPAAVPITGTILGPPIPHASCGNKVRGKSSGMLSYKRAVSHTLSEDTLRRLQERENRT